MIVQPSFGNGGRVFNVVSGSIDGGTTVIQTVASEHEVVLDYSILI